MGRKNSDHSAKWCDFTRQGQLERHERREDGSPGGLFRNSGRANNLLATPHIGYVSRGLYERFYRDTVTNITTWLDENNLASAEQ